MEGVRSSLIWGVAVWLLAGGCAHQRTGLVSMNGSMSRSTPEISTGPPQEPAIQLVSHAEQHAAGGPTHKVHAVEEPTIRSALNVVTVGGITRVADQQNEVEGADQLSDPELPPAPLTAQEIEELQPTELSLDIVIQSVYEHYPSLEAALFSRNVAAGKQLSAAGEFDTKLKAASENGPTGFYRNFRQSIGLVQPVFQGGEVFAGYRIGRGTFEPWYKERETNEGGEFKAGIVVPLARNQQIDDRRAELWKANYDRFLVEPEIQAQLIDFVQSASMAYWEWVAAGEGYRIALNILNKAVERTERVRDQNEQGLIADFELSDNLRLVAERKAKLAETEQKLQKAAIKLSLYYRDDAGQPIVPGKVNLPRFADPVDMNDEQLSADTQLALQQRPELLFYRLLQEQLGIEYAQACNQLLPEVDAVIQAGQDIGFPTSSKNDKGEFELDASIFVNVPIQRRKARGKIQSIEGKVAQVNAKRRLTENKIVADVQSAYAVMMTSAQQVRETREAIKYAEELAQRERENYEEGLSDMLKVTLREQYAFETQQKAIDALLQYYRALADYRAAIAVDRLVELQSAPQ